MSSGTNGFPSPSITPVAEVLVPAVPIPPVPACDGGSLPAEPAELLVPAELVTPPAPAEFVGPEPDAPIAVALSLPPHAEATGANIKANTRVTIGRDVIVFCSLAP